MTATGPGAALGRSGKYPRTLHVPSSPGGTRDDRRLVSLEGFVGVDVVVTEKLDGSNVALSRDHVFARSHGGAPAHPSFAPLKAIHAGVAWQIPEGVSVFGEWCHAVHSIRYPSLPVDAELSVFAVRDDADGTWRSWDDVAGLAAALGLVTVPELARLAPASTGELAGVLETHAQAPSVYGPDREGVVVRVAAAFDDFATAVAKWVRADHVQTDEHWSHAQVRLHRSP